MDYFSRIITKLILHIYADNTDKNRLWKNRQLLLLEKQNGRQGRWNESQKNSLLFVFLIKWFV